jgi:hypothetical protein
MVEETKATDYLAEAKSTAQWENGPVALATIALVERLDALIEELRAQRKPEMGRCAECKFSTNRDGRLRCIHEEVPCDDVESAFGCLCFKPKA